MAMSKIHTIAYVQPPTTTQSASAPCLRINTTVPGSSITVDIPSDITAFGPIRARYYFSRCVTQPEQCKAEVEDLVQMALDGYNSAAVFMSTGPLDSFKNRQTIIHQILSRLDEKLNESKEQDGNRSFQLHYAYLGLDEKDYYDLRVNRKLKKQEIDKNGWQAIMEPVDNADDIWKIPKYGARVPFVLKIRLSGSQHLLGTITVIDLLFPFCQPSDQSASFAEFVQFLNNYANVNYEGSIINDTDHLLTKITAECFYGSCKTVVFAFVNEYPDDVLRDTIDTLELMQTVREIRTVAMCNAMENRKADMYEQQLSILQHQYESEHNAASNLVQQLKVKDMDIHRLEADKEHVQHGLEERSEKMEFSLQLQRLKAAYDESKRTTKAAFLQKRINQLASMLTHAQDTIKKHHDHFQDIKEEQLPVKLEEREKIQDVKDEKTADGARKERQTQVFESLAGQLVQMQNELDDIKTIVFEKS
ncbi:hypothetical protein O0I10_011461 [Lichtheimia ornata]|uniref:Kinesin motor domain-containing protein n=1 Tax=Lichtheimia ornata TaxID=688661 RepID=A0AAD7UTM9_9FUNG|nr:uncharacterized protein O0I10_011461 [Lichtheimia ornata]KAJ8652861.1 hypothetical protein O0I10_011461 [Lichtheimia ornata]